MADKKSIPAYGTKTVLASLLGVSPLTIDQYLARGIVVKVPGRAAVYDIPASISKAFGHMNDIASNKASAQEDDPLREAKLLDYQAKTRKAELFIAEKEGMLLPADAVQEVFAKTIRSVALWVDSLPDSLERIGILDRRGIDRCRQECDAQRQRLYDLTTEELREQLPDNEPSSGVESDVNDARSNTPTEAGKRGRGRPKRS